MELITPIIPHVFVVLAMTKMQHALIGELEPVMLKFVCAKPFGKLLKGRNNMRVFKVRESAAK